jgi:uncharacterized protein (DUF427 family)
VASFQPPSPFVEPTERRIRVRLGDELVAQSDQAQLLVQYGPAGLPTYYLPEADIVDGALADEEAEAGQRTWTVQGGGQRAERAAWTHPDPSGPMAALAHHVTFSWQQLEWYEEDERVLRHAQDPHHRVDTRHSSRRIQVLAGGQVVADTARPLLLFETNLPTRYYLPFEDIRTELFEASTTTSVCPYKGRARYWSLRVGDTLIKDAAWSYPDPIPENPKIRDLVGFFQERIGIVIDGVTQERPVTAWSGADR